MDFVKTMMQRAATDTVRDSVPQRCPRLALDRKATRHLARIPGALDLLHALIRGMAFPNDTSVTCPTDECTKPLTIHHVLTAQHAGPDGSMPPDPATDLPYDIGPPASSTSKIMTRYVQGCRRTLAYVAKRVRLFTDCPTLTRWANHCVAQATV